MYSQQVLTLNASVVVRTLQVTAFCGFSSIATDEFFKEDKEFRF